METIQEKYVIEINDYGPDIKSLGFKTPEGYDATTGVMNPGKDLTCQTNRRERLTINSGRLEVFIEGTEASFILETGQTYTLLAKSKVTFRALDNHQVAYTCVYLPDEEKPQDENVDTSTIGSAAIKVIEN